MEQRSYNQYCATARTLDIVGERWTLLLVRELLTGPKRFGDLHNSLRGLGTGLLAARLKHLEQEGLAHKVILPAPARTPAYALTEAGSELGPAVLALASWGTKWAMGDRREEEAFQPGWAVLALRAFFNAEAAADFRATYEFRIGEQIFHADIDHGAIETSYGPAQRPEATIEINDDAFLEIAEGRSTLAEAIDAGRATVSGDKRALRMLHKLFRRPSPQTRRPEG